MKVHFIVNLAFLIAISALAGSCGDSEPTIKPVGTFNQVSPASGAKEVSTTPLFSWEQAEGAATYSLLVSRKSDFTVLALEEDELSTTTFTSSNPLERGVLYYWKVIAINQAGEEVSQNAGITFRTVSDPPTASPGVSKYYISAEGEDNPDQGTLQNPFKTLAYAATQVPANEGDTLYLKAGLFVETEPASIPVGVSVIGAGEALTTLSSSGVTLANGIDANSNNFKLWYDGSLIQLVSKHRNSFRNNNSPAVPPTNGNQTISGFTIDGNNKALKAGVWVENRNNVTLHHVTFRELAQRGAVFGPGGKDFYVYPEYYMTGIKIHDCTFINSGKDLADETLGNLCIAQLDGADIYNINITDNEGYGIKFMYDGYLKNTKIHDCTISLNESDAKWGEDIAIEVWNLGPGNEIYNINCNTWLSVVNHPDMFGDPTGTENMKIYNVKMIDTDGASSKEAVEIGAPGVAVYDSYFENKGFGMAIWDMGRKNISIHHNTFYNSALKNNWTGGAAIYIDNSRTWNFTNINIYHNVFDTHNYGVRMKRSNGNINGVQIKNNAFLNTAISEVGFNDANITNIQLDNNLKFTGAGLPWSFSPGIAESSNVLGDAGFLRTGNRWDTYYRPASGLSFVVDKGVDVGFSFTGSAPDIGRYEF